MATSSANSGKTYAFLEVVPSQRKLGKPFWLQSANPTEALPSFLSVVIGTKRPTIGEPFAMQTKARLQAKDANEVLFYIQAVDTVSQYIPTKEFHKIVAEPNLSDT